MMGVAGLAGDPAYPPKEFPLPPVPLGKVGHTLARGFNKLGWHWWPSDSAIATREYEGPRGLHQPGSVHRWAAPRGPRAAPTSPTGPCRHPRAAWTLRTRCRVREITVSSDVGHGGRRHLLRRRRQRAAQKAEIVVVACNGVGTPRLLLELRVRRSSPTDCQSQRSRGPQPHVPPLRHGHGRIRRAARGLQGTHGLLHHEPGVLRDRPSRAASCAATRSRRCAAWAPSRRPCWACRRDGVPWGAGTTRPTPALFDRTAGMVVDLRGPPRGPTTA